MLHVRGCHPLSAWVALLALPGPRSCSVLPRRFAAADVGKVTAHRGCGTWNQRVQGPIARGVYLALDFTPRSMPIEERKGLRDDWLALSNDFRVVKDRVQRDIAHDQLPQRSLLEHASRN